MSEQEQQKRNRFLHMHNRPRSAAAITKNKTAVSPNHLTAHTHTDDTLGPVSQAFTAAAPRVVSVPGSARAATGATAAAPGSLPAAADQRSLLVVSACSAGAYSPATLVPIQTLPLGGLPLGRRRSPCSGSSTTDSSRARLSSFVVPAGRPRPRFAPSAGSDAMAFAFLVAAVGSFGPGTEVGGLSSWQIIECRLMTARKGGVLEKKALFQNTTACVLPCGLLPAVAPFAALGLAAAQLDRYDPRAAAEALLPMALLPMVLPLQRRAN